VQYARPLALLSVTAVPPAADERSTRADVRDAALRAGTIAQLLIDRRGTLVFANDRATALFRLEMADVGRPLSDLDVS
jgi:two-component system, chemotaxis family, CheB/CheR fusion protein